jgi:hypothetical protein
VRTRTTLGVPPPDQQRHLRGSARAIRDEAV